MMTRKDWIDLCLNKNDHQNNPAYINSFIEICWPDPFKDEDFKLKKKNSNLSGFNNHKSTLNVTNVSDANIDYIENMSYEEGTIKKINFYQFPTKQVVMKMMRACIGVPYKEDLWIYHKHY